MKMPLLWLIAGGKKFAYSPAAGIMPAAFKIKAKR